jgi:hypothetical protein
VSFRALDVLQPDAYRESRMTCPFGKGQGPEIQLVELYVQLLRAIVGCFICAQASRECLRDERSKGTTWVHGRVCTVRKTAVSMQ